MSTIASTADSLSMRWINVWRRNFLVWRKLAIPSVLGSLADPMISMFGLGYGLGSLMPQVNGGPYIAFLAGGMLCASAMNAATFETLYSGFSRMQVQRTWDAIINAPLSLDDVVAGELVWAATKSLLSGAAILIIVVLLGLVAHSPLVLAVLPVVFLVGLAFSALGLIVTALAPTYDFFMYYFTLFITPMTFLSGVFFPLSQLPLPMQAAAQALPLTHAVLLVRPLLAGQWPDNALLHIGVLVAITIIAFMVALKLARRRLLK